MPAKSAIISDFTVNGGASKNRLASFGIPCGSTGKSFSPQYLLTQSRPRLYFLGCFRPRTGLLGRQRWSQPHSCSPHCLWK